MTGSAITTTSTGTLQTTNDRDRFDELVDLALVTVDSERTQRVYRQTFTAWFAWCVENGRDALEMLPGDVIAWLSAQDTTKATRQRQLSTMRKLTQMRFILSPDDDSARRAYEALKVVKAPKDTHAGNERNGRALTPAEADKILRVWNEDSDKHARNRALVAVLLLSGVRRSEAATLRWSNIDFENGVLTVLHGKGDKRREVPVAGDFALDALRAWQMRQPADLSHVFTSLKKNGQAQNSDRPLSGVDVGRVWKATAQNAGIEATTAHDARRTLITDALDGGTPLATVQGIAGHARGETTLGYAETVNARQARKRLKLRYG